MTKEVYIPTKDKAYNDEDKINIYEGNSKALNARGNKSNNNNGNLFKE